MSGALKVSISGVRGIIGNPEGLTPELIINFAQAFGTYAKGGKIVVGSDSRPTYEMVKHAVFSGLMATGCDVIDIGIVPTPTVLLMVKKYKANGGIAITASHNPLDWNALKLIHKEGRFLNQKEANKLIALYESKKYNIVSWKKIGKTEVADQKKVWDEHINLVFKQINVKKIKSKKFTVAIDPVNGAGAGITKYFLEKLGCKVVSINNEPTGLFGRKPEPVPSSLGDLGALTKNKKAVIGFAQDPDADRLAAVDETGTPLGEEYSLVLAIDWILQKKKGPVVLNLATSLASEEVAKKHGQKVYRTKIGEINVTEKMFKIKGLIGGEGNGGVIYPTINSGRDSFAGMGLILDYMASTGKKISELKAAMPQYVIVKKKKPVEGINVEKVIKKIIKQYSSNKISTLDGVRILFDQAWVIIRPSNTEPIIRVMAEAKTAKEANALANKFLKEIQ